MSGLETDLADMTVFAVSGSTLTAAVIPEVARICWDAETPANGEVIAGAAPRARGCGTASAEGTKVMLVQVSEEGEVVKLEVATERDTTSDGLIEEYDLLVRSCGGGGEGPEYVGSVGVDFRASEIKQEGDGT